MSARLPSTLHQAAAVWRQWPWTHHLIAVLLLMLITVGRWPFLTNWIALGDEALYLEAFETQRTGDSPYDVEGFFYPLVFARLGAGLLEVLGAAGTLAVLRAANLLGLGLAFWALTIWLPLSMRRRGLVAAALLCLSPAVYAGLDLGNISFSIVGLAIVSLLSWARWPLLAGVVLGVSVALKPIAAAAIPILGLHRPRGASVARRHGLAAAVAAATTFLLLLPISGLRQMLEQDMVELAYHRSFSLQRLLALLGVDLPQVFLTLTVIALATAGARWRPMSSTQLLAYVVATISLATPLVWNHTLIVALPVQGLALALAWRRGSDATNPTRRLEPIFVVLGIAMMHAGTTAGFDHLAPLIQVAFLVIAGLMPAAICTYVFWLAEEIEIPSYRVPLPTVSGRSQPRDR